ncbi:hypothetical protein KC340_g50 [Hortaea werneckii]|nr:hypothetical protein KC340_g50 [Hortaea werneckii]
MCLFVILAHASITDTVNSARNLRAANYIHISARHIRAFGVSNNHEPSSRAPGKPYGNCRGSTRHGWLYVQ